MTGMGGMGGEVRDRESFFLLGHSLPHVWNPGAARLLTHVNFLCYIPHDKPSDWGGTEWRWKARSR